MTDERSGTNILTSDSRRKDRDTEQALKALGPGLSGEQAKLQLISIVEIYGIQRVKLWIRNIEEMR